MIIVYNCRQQYVQHYICIFNYILEKETSCFAEETYCILVTVHGRNFFHVSSQLCTRKFLHRLAAHLVFPALPGISADVTYWEYSH